ncbi:hypothetical protein TNCV_4138521 [Trichonephila clavipes]|nr:hypothetical protein TNCV_4138521 [Trichonephila clavipes]
MWSMVAQQLTQITPPFATPDQLWQRVEAAWSTVPQEHIQSFFESLPMLLAKFYASANISNEKFVSRYDMKRRKPNDEETVLKKGKKASQL